MGFWGTTGVFIVYGGFSVNPDVLAGRLQGEGLARLVSPLPNTEVVQHLTVGIMLLAMQRLPRVVRRLWSVESFTCVALISRWRTANSNPLEQSYYWGRSRCVTSLNCHCWNERETIQASNFMVPGCNLRPIMLDKDP
jgi:hypothetical protein